MQRFYRSVFAAVCGLVLLLGLAAYAYAWDGGLKEVFQSNIDVYAASSRLPPSLDYMLQKGKVLGPLPDEKLDKQKTVLAEDFDATLPLDGPKGSLTVVEPTEVRKSTGEEYRLSKRTAVDYKLPAASYKVKIPKGAKLEAAPPGAYALAQDVKTLIYPPDNLLATLTVKAQTIVERVPVSAGAGATLRVQPDQAPSGEYVTLTITKKDFDFSKARFDVSMRRPGEDQFEASDDEELVKVQMDSATLRARVPSIVGISGVHLAEPVDLLVTARGPNDNLAEILYKEFKISSKLLAVLVWLAAFLIPWFVAGLVKRPRVVSIVRVADWRHALNPVWFVTGKDGKASLSLAQILVWTILVFSASFYVWVASGKLLDFSNDILTLLGIAGGASVIAKITSSAKDEKRLKLAEPAAKPPKWLDLFQTDGQADLYKFQMALFTLLAVLFVTGKIFSTLEFPQLSAGLLTLIGISNGVYLTAKGTTKTVYEKLAGKFDELSGAKEKLQRAEADADRATTDLKEAETAKNKASGDLTQIQPKVQAETDPARKADLQKQADQAKAESDAAEKHWKEAQQKQKDADARKTAAKGNVDKLQAEFEELKKTI